eukprot:Gb_36816 [translate_table: standard]
MAVTRPQVCTNSLEFRPSIRPHSSRRFRTHDGRPKCVYASSIRCFRLILSGHMKKPANVWSERAFLAKRMHRGRLSTVGVEVKAGYGNGNADVDLYGESVADDYYSVLGVVCFYIRFYI